MSWGDALKGLSQNAQAIEKYREAQMIDPEGFEFLSETIEDLSASR